MEEVDKGWLAKEITFFVFYLLFLYFFHASVDFSFSATSSFHQWWNVGVVVWDEVQTCI